MDQPEQPTASGRDLEAALRSATTASGESLWDISRESRALVILLRHLG